MPPLPEGDFRFFTGACRGDIGVDQEMSCAVSRSEGSNRPSQMGLEGSRVAGTAGRVATGPLWGRKYDCTEVLLTSLVVRRSLGDGLRLRIPGEGLRLRTLVSRGAKSVSSPAPSWLSVSLEAFSHLSDGVGCWRGDFRLDAVLRAGLNAWMLGLRASFAVIVSPIIVSVSVLVSR